MMWTEYEALKEMIAALPWWSKKQKAELQEQADMIFAELVME